VAVESFGHVILYVRDLDVSAAFYRDVVGLAFKLRDAGYAEFVTGETRFGLLERTRGRPWRSSGGRRPIARCGLWSL
jgi:catechol 2,3-dioxygenase-like lactoylglutathione lyase family enzyme